MTCNREIRISGINPPPQIKKNISTSECRACFQVLREAIAVAYKAQPKVQMNSQLLRCIMGKMDLVFEKELEDKGNLFELYQFYIKEKESATIF